MSQAKNLAAVLAVAALAAGGTAALHSSASAQEQCLSTGIAIAERPVFTDADNSVDGDTVLIPASSCVHYTLNGTPVPAGTHKIADYADYAPTDSSYGWSMSEATVIAEAEEGYALSGYYLWRQGFIGVYGQTSQKPENPQTDPAPGTPAPAETTPAPAPTTPASVPTTPAAVTKEVTALMPELSGKTQIVIPNVEGVQYYVDNQPVAAGTIIDVPVDVRREVTVGALEGYVLTNPEDAWFYRNINGALGVMIPALQAVEAPVPVLEGNELTIPDVEKVQYYIDGTPVNPGTITLHRTVIVTVASTSNYLVLANSDIQWKFTPSIPAPTIPAPTATPSTPTPTSAPTTPAPKPTTPSTQPTSETPKVVSFLKPTFNYDVNQYIIPDVEGLEYFNGTTQLQPGTYDVNSWDKNGRSTVSITARPVKGYVADGGYSSYTWTATFTRTVNAQAPAFNPRGSKASDTFTIPSSTGVEYYANGKKVGPGTHKVADYAKYAVTSSIGKTKISSAKLTVEARGTEGYQVAGTYQWTQQFLSASDSSVTVITGDNDKPLLQVSPKAPAYKAGWKFWFINVPAKYTIPQSTGIDYYVNGQLTKAGMYKIPAGTTVRIEAKPQAGYTFPYNAVTVNQWTFSSY